MVTYSPPSKLVGERVTLAFSFADIVLWGETLSSAACTVEIVSGTDAEPDEVLYLLAAVDGLSVTQQVYRGLAGVIYLIVCTTESSLGHTYIKAKYLAVLPDNDVAPPLIFDGQVDTVEMTSGA